MTTNPSPGSPRASVSVLGLGMMGGALAAAFLKAGHRTTVWNRSAAKTGPLVAQGAAPAATSAEAVAASDLVVVCLTTYANVEEVLTPLDLTGKTLVNLTNGTPAQARAFAKTAGDRGARYVDGGIMAVPQMIAGPGAYILYSGDQEAYEAHRATLAALADTHWTGTDPGRAALYDLALLTGMYGMIAGVLQAYALVGTEGVPAKEFHALLEPWVGAMLRGTSGEWAEAIDSGEHLTDVSSLAVNQAAFPNLLSTYADQGIDGQLLAPFQELLDRAVAAGHAADGMSRLVEVIQRRARAASTAQ
ncbi:NAD(P)-dependent oxidoreductase [Streptomyces sp. Da 82-17]|uniref:NAD(P)-dependent oxidoreductase n=1 Tax=Streptomyces sp. Da 82-17 TaxID=3377116 RepID=UPI0038D3BC07